MTARVSSQESKPLLGEPGEVLNRKLSKCFVTRSARTTFSEPADDSEPADNAVDDQLTEFL